MSIIPLGFYGESVVALVVAADAECAGPRDRTLAASGPDGWRDVSNELIDEDFCDRVESGTFVEKAARWR